MMPAFAPAALWRHLGAGPAVEPSLRDAVRWVLGNPGRLVRARLAHAAAVRFGLGAGRAERLACAVEYFHVASLVLDDLPCMDDAALRRGRACVHRRHGEAVAILAALALINRAYALADGALAAAPAGVRRAARGWLERGLGLEGLVGGQARDLAFGAGDRSPRAVGRIAAGKTGGLLTLAVLLPAELARPSAAERRALRALCVHWGQLYQLEDDLADALAGPLATGKSSGRDQALGRPNLVHVLGLDGARRRRERLRRLLAAALARLDALGGGRWDHLRAVAAAPGAIPAAVERSAA